MKKLKTSDKIAIWAAVLGAILGLIVGLTFGAVAGWVVGLIATGALYGGMLDQKGRENLADMRDPK